MLSKIGFYMPLINTILFLIAAWHWGDWRNWRNYYPTVLFVITLSLVAFTLTHNYPLWLYHKSFIFPNRTFQEFRLDFLMFPPICLLYLTFHPYKSQIIYKLLYMTSWIILVILIEGFLAMASILTYHNGWSLGWSLVLWIIHFPVVALHYKRPLQAWLVSAGFTIFSIIYFHIPFV